MAKRQSLGKPLVRGGGSWVSTLLEAVRRGMLTRIL
jgi:uncharacterized protein (DUF433 family)